MFRLSIEFAMQRRVFSFLLLSAVLRLTPEAQAQTVLEFGFDPNTRVVNSVTLSGSLTFTATTNYTYSSGIQVRIFDLYPSVAGAVTSSTIGGTFQLAPNASGLAGLFYAISSPNTNLGGTTGGDVIIWNSESYSFTTGQVLTLSGQSAITVSSSYPNNPLLAPTSGQYAIYLASQWDGTLLTDPIIINVAGLAIPEPSTGAGLFGLSALACVAYRRWRRRAD